MAEFVFFSSIHNVKSRTQNYFNGMKKKDKPVRWIDCNFNDLFRISMGTSRKRLRSAGCVLLVCSPSHILVIFIFFLLQKRPILDAGWPLSDGVITSRKEFGFLGLKALKIFFIDFFSFHLSKKVFVESELQKTRVCRHFLLSRDKVFVIETGFDENRFESFFPNKHQRDTSLTSVIFRGGNQVESGLNLLLEAIQKNLFDAGSFRFRIITNSNETNLECGDFVEISTLEMSDLELFTCYRFADVALGQLSDHKRLGWTIPHKFYEAAFLGLPYISADTPFMKELAEQKGVVVFKGGSVIELVNCLKNLSVDLVAQRELSKNLTRIYHSRFSQDVLSRTFEFIAKT